MIDTRPLAVYTDTDDLDPSIGVQLLSDNGFRVEILETRDPDEIAVAAAEATALLVGYAKVDAQLLARLPQVKIVSLLSRGFDGVDIAAAADRGVWVATVGSVASEEVSTHAWALTLAMLRQLPFFLGFPVERAWLDRPETLPRRLSEVTVGVLGLGQTGRRYAALAAPVAGGVLGWDVRGEREGEGPGLLAGIDGAEVVDLDTLLARSDVISLHLPLTESTIGFINPARLAAMRSGVFLVNIARGPLIDSSALLAALTTGQVAGAALDVFATEPPAANDPLLTHPRVLTTPHVAYLSDATEAGYVMAQANNVVAWAKTGRPELAVNSPGPAS